MRTFCKRTVTGRFYKEPARDSTLVESSHYKLQQTIAHGLSGKVTLHIIIMHGIISHNEIYIIHYLITNL